MKKPFEHNKKLFDHNKELDKAHVHCPFEDFVDYNKDFYKADRKDLLELMSFEERTSPYIVPDPRTPDVLLLRAIIKAMNGMVESVTGQKIQLRFHQGEDSYNEYSGLKITVSLGPMFDHRLPFYSRLNSLFGVTFHEAMHTVFTTPGAERMLRSKGYTKAKINRFNGSSILVPDYKKIGKLFLDNKLYAMLFNIVEDRRIERKGLEKFPGYIFYMDDHRKYALWMHKNHILDRKVKRDYTDQDKYWSAVTMYIAYRVFSPELLPDYLKVAPKDKKFVEIMQKVDEIVGVSDETFEETHLMATKLFALYPKEQQDKAQGKSSEASEEGEEINQGPDDQRGDKKLSEKMVKALQEAIAGENKEPQVKEHKIDKVIMTKGSVREFDKVAIRPAREGAFEPSVYKEAVEISRTVSKHLSFLDSRYNRMQEMFEMRSGELDEDELYGLQHNRNIFVDTEEAPGYHLDVGVLIDESGSMGGRDKIRQAQTAALGLALALRHNKHISLFVYGHTADHRGGENVTMYSYLDPVERMDNINTLFSVEARSNNADGYAIAEMGTILAKGKARQKVLMVISDGQPAASCYGDGVGHTHDMVERLERQNIFVVQICVDNIERSGEMFTNFIPYNKDNLGLNLKKVLLKKLVEISNQV